MQFSVMSGLLVAGLVVATWVGASGAEARGLFVSQDGRDSNAVTREAPFRTIAKASAAAGPGDVVTLRAGTYEESIRPVRDGAEGRPIVYQGESTQRAGEHAPEVRIANVGTGGAIDGRSWVTFRDLSFGNCTEHWIYGENAHHITVEDCAFDAAESDKVGWAGLGVYGGSYLTVRRCKFGTWGSPSSRGIGDMVTGRPCDYTLVEDCDFRGAHAGH